MANEEIKNSYTDIPIEEFELIKKVGEDIGFAKGCEYTLKECLKVTGEHRFENLISKNKAIEIISDTICEFFDEEPVESKETEKDKLLLEVNKAIITNIKNFSKPEEKQRVKNI